MAKFSFNAFNQSPYLGTLFDLPTQIDAAAAAGFDYFGPDTYVLETWIAEGRSLQALADRLAGHNMRCWEIAAGLILAGRAESVAAAASILPLASALRPTWVQINVGAPVGEETPSILAEVCDILAPTGARIALEYLPFTPLSSVTESVWLAEQVGFNRAGVLIDTWHHFRGPDSDRDLDAVPLDAIAYVQFDDALPPISADLTDETVNRRTFPGEGEFELHGFCGRLKAKGFDGVVSVEIINSEWRDRDIFEFARRAYDSTVPYWA
jgi:sugar phosphate isomerase/epimerase